MLFGPSGLHAKGEEADGLLSEETVLVIKFASRSKKFANLAANNICIILENERSFKKLFVKTKVA